MKPFHLHLFLLTPISGTSTTCRSRCVACEIAELWGVADAEVFRCALLSWCVAWHQVPAGSLPMPDADLCRLVGLGRDLKTWKKIKASAMRGWRPFADGRLYHPVVSEKVVAA